MSVRTRRGVDRYVAMVVVLGVVLLGSWSVLVEPARPNLTSVGVLLALGVLSILLPLRVYRPNGVQGYHLTGAIFVAGLSTLPLFWVPFLPVAACVVAFPFVTRDVRKTLFNVAQDAIWAVLAGVVVLHVVGVGDAPTSPRTVVASLVASAIVVISNSIVLGGLFRRLSGDNPSAEQLLLSLGVGVGHTIYGIVLATTLIASPVAALLTAVMLVAVFMGYRGYAGLLEEQHRVQGLHRVSQELVEATGINQDLRPFLQRLAELFGASRADLHLMGRGVPHHAVWPPHAEGPPEGSSLQAVLEYQGQAVGTVTLTDRLGIEPWSDNDATLLRSVANDLAVVIQNHGLFAEVQQEREALAAETRKLTDILDAASDGITLVGTDDRIVSWNPGMTAITGIATEDAAGRPWYSLLRLRDENGDEVTAGDPHVLSMALKGVRGESSALWQVMHDDGEWRWVRCTAAPVARGTEHGAVLVMGDVTSETEVDQLKNDFIATVSHELRTPMTPLKGFLGTLLKHDQSFDEEQRRIVLASMDGQVRRLDTLVGDLLAVAELARGQFDLRATQVHCGDLVRAIVDARTDPERGRVQVDVRANVYAMADPEGARRIVHSLVDNALKHTEGRIRVVVDRAGEAATVVVADEGPGIPHRDQDRIFDRFVRLGNHLHRTQGPGLGLTIARALATQMHGAVVVRSQTGSGATFEVRLPAVPTGDDGDSDSLAAAVDDRSTGAVDSTGDRRGTPPTSGPAGPAA